MGAPVSKQGSKSRIQMLKTNARDGDEKIFSRRAAKPAGFFNT
jgi:hypothetical protein